MRSLSVTIQTKQYFPVVLFVKLYKVVLTFQSVEEIPKQLRKESLKQFMTSAMPVQCSTN